MRVHRTSRRHVLPGLLVLAALVGGPGAVAAQTPTAATIPALGPYSILVPMAAKVGGLEQTNWVTDAVVHNAGSTAAAVRLYFLEKDHDNSGVVGRDIAVQPYSSLYLGDVVLGTFGRTGVTGAILLDSDAPLLVTSRTYNDQPAGTFGQYVPGFPLDRAVIGTAAVRLIQLTSTAAYRTNIGFTNVTPSSTPVHVELFRADGSPLGSFDHTLKPWEYDQETNAIGSRVAGEVADAYAIVSSSQAGARYFVYASVIDNRTGDPVTVLPVGGRPDPGPDAPAALAADPTTVFSDGFEGTFPGAWQHYFTMGSTNRNVEWGRVTCKTATGAGAIWCAAGGSAPQSPCGTYVPGMGTWLEYGPFSLAGAAEAWMEFDLWMDTENGRDKVSWSVSTDANSYYHHLSSGTTNGWQHVVFNFKEPSTMTIVGAPQVWVALIFISDSSVEKGGVFIDNVVIRKSASSCPVPVVSAPATATTGASYAVSWTATSADGRYEIDESTYSDFYNATRTTVTGTSQTFSHAVTQPTTYYYRVRALSWCASGQPSAWSAPTQTVVSVSCSAPQSPVISGPAQVASGGPYTVTWTATMTDARYDIDEATDASFTGVTRTRVYATAMAFSHEATAATSYFYRVRAVSRCGGVDVPSEWSGTRTVEVSPDVPVDLWVPSVASVIGTAGTNWKTDLEVHNPGAVRAEMMLGLLKRDQENPSPVEFWYGLDPGTSLRLYDVVAQVFGHNGAGTLRIRTLAGEVVASARTYNDQTEGTYGQFIGAVRASDSSAKDEEMRLVQLSHSGDPELGFRTNLGLVNLTGIRMTVDVTLYDAQGGQYPIHAHALRPWESIQLSPVFPGFSSGDWPEGYIAVRGITPGGRFLAYASVVDNRSGDPIYIPALAVDEVSAMAPAGGLAKATR